MKNHDCATYEGEGDDIAKASENARGVVEVYIADGSASICPETGEKHVGAAVVRLEEGEYEIIVQKRLPEYYSAQAAELGVLTEALLAAKWCAIIIYSDSAYAITNVHAGLSRWRRRGFRRADGSPVQHAELLNDLIKALAEPIVVALVKCQAHTHNCDKISLGKAAAYAAAKKAAYFSKPLPAECVQRTSTLT
ncbi:ribonuclease H-like [Ambystoma mexicanum]|uniref:ribonuclease H-like n=1 Tax=Ambystoma mexicanum TaxID=8296 RepID=UPI0037E8A59A